MLIGMATTLVWRFGVRFRVEGLKDVHEVIPAFVLSFVAYLAISKMTARHRPSEKRLEKIFG
ncbi:MAG: hypothetical protein R2724_27995 [Bryobacterales bacterium]